MNDFNLNLTITFSIALLALLVLAYLVPKQMLEVMRPKDWLTGLRWQILGVLVVSIVGLVPSVVYLALRNMGTESEALRTVAGISGNVSRLANAILLVMIFSYRRKE